MKYDAAILGLEAAVVIKDQQRRQLRNEPGTSAEVQDNFRRADKLDGEVAELGTAIRILRAGE
jgi:hypothetical protein